MTQESTWTFFTPPKVSAAGLKKFKNLSPIIADAQARSRPKPDEVRSVLEGFSPGAVMTEAGRLAKNRARDELQGRGITVSSVEASEIKKVGNALLEADLLKFIETAKTNLEKRNYGRRRGSPH